MTDKASAWMARFSDDKSAGVYVPGHDGDRSMYFTAKSGLLIHREQLPVDCESEKPYNAAKGFTSQDEAVQYARENWDMKEYVEENVIDLIRD